MRIRIPLHKGTMQPTDSHQPRQQQPNPQPIEGLAEAIDTADAVVLGAGAGLSAAAGFTYSGPRFQRLFGDFERAYGFHDMYSGGFYPLESLEHYWAYWSRFIYCNRYDQTSNSLYRALVRLLEQKDHFVITTNVDYQFQLAGQDKSKLFYTQGDYGLFQCSKPCSQITYDNKDLVERMVAEQCDLQVPSKLVPYCPRCGRPLTMNLRCDGTFVQDKGWHAAAKRYGDFIHSHEHGRVLYLELGVGANTPGIIKYPFWNMAMLNPDATYACVNMGECYAPEDLAGRSILIDADIATAISAFADKNGSLSTPHSNRRPAPHSRERATQPFKIPPTAQARKA